MTVKAVFVFVQDAAHAIAPLAGAATFVGSALAIGLGHFGVPQETTMAVAGSVGAGIVAVSKWIDSRSFTNLQAEAIRADGEVRVAAAYVARGDVVDAAKAVAADVAQYAQAPPVAPPAAPPA